MKSDNTTEVDELAELLAVQQRDIDLLRRRVDDLEARSISPLAALNAAREAIVKKSLDEVLRVTREMFGNATTEWLEDPDMPDARYLIVNVLADGTPQQLVQRSIEWHRRVAEYDPEHLGAFRFSAMSPNESC